MPEKKVNQPVEKTKPKYEQVGKETITQITKQSIPKQFIPTKRFATILGLIFLAVVILALTQLPFGKFLSGDLSVAVQIGYPWPFLEFGLADIEASPLRPINFLLDLILYLIISYIIDISISLIAGTHIIDSKAKLKQRPQVYETIKPSIAEKVIKKTFKGLSQPPSSAPPSA